MLSPVHKDTYIIELRHDELGQIAILVEIAHQRRTVRLIVAMRAADADMGSTLNGPAGAVAIDNRTVDGQETCNIL